LQDAKVVEIGISIPGMGIMVDFNFLWGLGELMADRVIHTKTLSTIRLL